MPWYWFAAASALARFIVQGSEADVLEGCWPGMAIVLSFPTWAKRARLVQIGGLSEDPAPTH